MELYGRGQPCQYIERFTTLLSKGLVRPWLRHSEAPGAEETGRGFVAARSETTDRSGGSGGGVGGG